MEAKALFIIVIISLLSVAGLKRAAISSRMEVLFALMILGCIWGGVLLGANQIKGQATVSRFVADSGKIYRVLDSGKVLKLETEGTGQVIMVPVSMTKKAA